MSPYLIFYFVIAGTAVAEFLLREKGKFIKWLCIADLIMIALALCFRFGQGTDYIGYEIIYQRMKATSFLEFLTGRVARGLRGEWIFYAVCFLLSRLNIPYQIFIGIIACLSVWLLSFFLKQYAAHLPCMALLLLYQGYILIYQFSALREGLVMAFFLGILFPKLERREWLSYYAVALLCTQIHSVAYLYLFLPLLLKWKERWIEIATIISFLFALTLGVLQKWMAIMPDGIRISWSAFFLRALICFVCAAMYHYVQDKSSAVACAYKIALFAGIVYFLLAWTPLISSRMYESIRYTDLVLIVTFLEQKNRAVLRGICGVVLVFYSFGLTVKNIDASINQGYQSSVNVWNYPYISIFHPERMEDYTIDPKELGL